MNTTTDTTTKVLAERTSINCETFELIADGDVWQLRSSRAVTQPEASGPIDDLDQGRALWALREAIDDGDPTVIDYRPEGHETITNILARGGDPGTLPHLGMLIESAVHNRLRWRPLSLVTTRRLLAEAQALGTASLPPMTGELTEEEREAKVKTSITRYLHELEVLDDDIAERFLAACDPAVVGPEMDEANLQIDIERRPWNIEITDRITYRCAITGDVHEGQAIRLVGRGWVGDEVADITGCLTFNPTALAALAASAPSA